MPIIFPRLIAALATAAILALSHNAYSDSFSCPAQASWVSNPSAPSEVPLGENADFCQFYQFSWQWFLQLMAPSPDNASERNFQVQENYPVLEANQENSCDDKITSMTLTRSLDKMPESFNIPDRTGQAGTSNEGIYDQAGKVVYYDVRFSRNMCDIGKIQSTPNFPPGTTEIKTAWKQLTSNDDANDYLIMTANIDGVAGEETLGLIGFHIAIATELHPEMIWASFEHMANAPRCNTPSEANTQWSFASKACIEAPSDCQFNQAVEVTEPSGHAPTEICRVHPFGTKQGDPNFKKNITAINDLNAQINALVSELTPSDPMHVLKNYFNIGALWLNDITQPSASAKGDVPNIANQRGSLRLANTVMETTFQDGFKSATTYQEYSSNCFGCHEYTVDPYYRNTGPHNRFDVSHIFINDILAGQCKTPSDVATGPIWSDKDAQAKCAKTCETQGGWNGNWRTTSPGASSVCACCGAP
ncbi:MAG TPA: mannan-binding lectin [Marinagarivorans sp.]